MKGNFKPLLINQEGAFFIARETIKIRNRLSADYADFAERLKYKCCQKESLCNPQAPISFTGRSYLP
jgi:hypothetical protein